LLRTGFDVEGFVARAGCEDRIRSDFLFCRHCLLLLDIVDAEAGREDDRQHEGSGDEEGE